MRKGLVVGVGSLVVTLAAVFLPLKGIGTGVARPGLDPAEHGGCREPREG